MCTSCMYVFANGNEWDNDPAQRIYKHLTDICCTNDICAALKYIGILPTLNKANDVRCYSYAAIHGHTSDMRQYL